MGPHGQAAPSPQLQSINEIDLYQRDIQLVERVQHTTTHQNPKDVLMYETRRCLGEMKELLYLQWNGEVKPSSKLLPCKVKALSASPTVVVAASSDVSRLISAGI